MQKLSRRPIQNSRYSRTMVGTRSRLNQWVMSLFHPDGKNSSFAEDALLMIESRLMVGRRETEKGLQTVFFTPTVWAESRLFLKKKNRPLVGKCTITANGNLIKTPSAGSTWPEQKESDCSFGKQGLAIIFQCRPASKQWNDKDKNSI